MLHSTQALLPIVYEIGTKMSGSMAKPAKPALVWRRGLNKFWVIVDKHTAYESWSGVL